MMQLLMMILIFLFGSLKGSDFANQSRVLLHRKMNNDFDRYLATNKVRYIPLLGGAMDFGQALYLSESYKPLIDINVEDTSQWNDYITRVHPNIHRYNYFKNDLFKLSILWIQLTGVTCILAGAFYARDGSDHYIGFSSILSAIETILRISALVIVYRDVKKLKKNCILIDPPLNSIYIPDQTLNIADVESLV
jgi:hypothetical protein